MKIFQRRKVKTMKETKKKISLALALLMSVTLLATGCKKTNEDTDGLNDTASSTSSITQMTTTTPETTTSETTTKEEETTTTESETVTSEPESSGTDTESTTSASETTTSATSATTTTASETTENKSWNETEISEVMYTSQACYSRKIPVIGAETVAQYKKGTKVNVVAATDTGYYKLADGSFIHADYLTDEKPAVTTTVTSNPDIIEDDEPSGGSSTGVGSATTVKYAKDYTDRYAYKTLSADEKILYRNIVDAAYNFQTEVIVPDSLLSDDIARVYGMVFNQEPQLFWISRKIPTGYGSINIQYEYDKNTVASMQKEIDKNVKSILSKANEYTGTIGKLKVFYDWIIKNNTFSKSDNTDTCGIYNGLTVGGELQCAGYAKSMLYLCDLAGIDCMTIVGTNPEGLSHAWNIVYCDNGWYNLDPTWGDPVNDIGSADYVRYNYFLVPDEWIKNDHINVNLLNRGGGRTIKYFDPPACTKTSCNYFKAYNKEYSTLDDAKEGMKKEVAAAVKANKNVAHIRVTDKKIWDSMTSMSYAKELNKYAMGLGASTISTPQTTYNDGVLVVQYNIYY